MRAGGLPSNATRIAPEVPTINPARVFPTQPAPMLFADPSPIDGNHSAFLSRGHRRRYFSSRRNVYGPADTSGTLSGFTARNRSRPASHCIMRISKTPVADAIDMLVVAIPKRRSDMRSLSESQRDVL